MSAQSEESIPGFVTGDKISAVRAGEIKPPMIETNDNATIRCNETLQGAAEVPDRVPSVFKEDNNDALQRLAAIPKRESPILSRIYSYLQDSCFPVEPSQIASDLDLNQNTVRSYCNRLRDDGRIKQPYSRHFCSLGCNASIHGVGILARGSLYDGGAPQASGGVGVQNMVMSYSIPIPIKYDDYIYSVFDVDVRLEFGSKRDKVNLYVSGPYGVSIHSLSLIVTGAERYLEDLGFTKPSDWWMVNYEVLVNGVRVTVGGAESYTYQAFRGDLFKLYNKEFGVRGEFRSSDPIKFREFMSILSGHASDLRMVARMGAIEDEIRRLTEAVKHSNAGGNLS